MKLPDHVSYDMTTYVTSDKIGVTTSVVIRNCRTVPGSRLDKVFETFTQSTVEDLNAYFGTDDFRPMTAEEVEEYKSDGEPSIVDYAGDDQNS